MDNDDGMGGVPLDNNNNDYGDEGYDPNQDGDVDGGNDGGADGNGEDGDVDQYFDDAGDVGYLPADHVTSIQFSMFHSPWWPNFKTLWPSNWQTSMKGSISNSVKR